MKQMLVLTLVMFALLGLSSGCSRSPKTGGQAIDSANVPAHPGERKVLYWYDPMNPTVRFERPGKSPFMDMDLQPRYADEGADNPDVISVDPAMIQNIGVVTAPVERRTLTRTINTYGVVTPDEKSISDINARVGGWIDKLYFDYTGMEVHKGQPMAVIYSPELIAAEQELLQAVHFASAGGNSATQSQTLITSARDRLAFFGMSEKQIDELQKAGAVIDRVVIHAQVDGVILEKDVYEGQKILSGETLFRVADLRRVWILADVFNIDMPFLRAGSPATVAFDRSHTRTGTVDFVYPQVDATARSVKVRIPLPNPGLFMKVGQYADVAIHSPVRYNAIAVPSQAVINTGLRQVVAVALGGGKFEMRNVKLGPFADGFYAVAEGLNPGETIVTSGQFLIDSDANLQAAGASLMGAMPGMNMSNPAQKPSTQRGTEVPTAGADTSDSTED